MKKTFQNGKIFVPTKKLREELLPISRREFIKTTATGGAFFLAAPQVLADEKTTELDFEVESHGLNFFTARERKYLAYLCEHSFSSSASMGAPLYIEQLLTAFECNPPKIFAKDTTTKEFMPLNRVQTAYWKLRLYGSENYPGGYWNEDELGTVKGWRQIFKEGLSNALNLGIDMPEMLSLNPEFAEVFHPLLLESCFALPTYGGNQNQQGWQLISFPGDSLPTGYSIFNPETQTYSDRPDTPMTKFDKADPNKMSFLTKLFCRVIAFFQGGRMF